MQLFGSNPSGSQKAYLKIKIQVRTQYLQGICSQIHLWIPKPMGLVHSTSWHNQRCSLVITQRCFKTEEASVGLRKICGGARRALPLFITWIAQPLRNSEEIPGATGEYLQACLGTQIQPVPSFRSQQFVKTAGPKSANKQAGPVFYFSSKIISQSSISNDLWRLFHITKIFSVIEKLLNGKLNILTFGIEQTCTKASWWLICSSKSKCWCTWSSASKTRATSKPWWNSSENREHKLKYMYAIIALRT